MRHIEATSLVDLLSDTPELLTAAEVANIFRVDATTVIRWTKEN